MPIVECKNERCAWYRRKVTVKGFVERCVKNVIHINQAGICRSEKPKLKRAIQTHEALKKKG